MLRILRKKGVAKKILWVLAVIITISFVFWGISSSLTRRENAITYAGKIFGRTISFQEFENALRRTQNQAILRYGQDFYKIRGQVNMNAEAWDRLILLEEGKKRKIKIGNEEVITAVKNFPFFQRDKKFDNALYRQTVEYVFRCTPRDFEETVRESLLFEKIYKAETTNAALTDDDAFKQYNMEKGRIQVDYIVFPFKNYEKESSLSEEAVKQYYEKNKDAFRMPFAVNVNYATLYYPPSASEDAKKTIGETAQTMANDMVKNKLTLKQLGEKYKISVNESGLFSAEEPNMTLGWPWEIFQRALALKKDAPPSVFKTDRGFYFLELKESRPPRLLAFEEAKARVKAAMSAVEAKKTAEAKARETLAGIQQELAKDPNGKFDAIAKKMGLQVEKTPEFNMAQYLPGVGPSPQFHQAAFNLTKEKPLSEPIEIANGYAILYLNNMIPASRADFDKEKETIKEGLLAKRRDQAFNDFMVSLRQKAKLVDNIKKIEEQATRKENNG